MISLHTSGAQRRSAPKNRDIWEAWQVIRTHELKSCLLIDHIHVTEKWFNRVSALNELQCAMRVKFPHYVVSETAKINVLMNSCDAHVQAGPFGLTW